jgi:hypothetical protein
MRFCHFDPEYKFDIYLVTFEMTAQALFLRGVVSIYPDPGCDRRISYTCFLNLHSKAAPLSTPLQFHEAIGSVP